MLTDAERKLYRVLFHSFTKDRQMPTWAKLEAKTGLSKAELTKRLVRLHEAGELLWEQQDSPATVLLIREPFLKPDSKPAASTANYFTDY